MKKQTVKKMVTTLLLLLLCVLAQLLENSSVYLSEALVCAVLVICTLACGYVWGAVLALLTPLTGWLVTGSQVISRLPQILPCHMLANLLLVSLMWIFVKWLSEKMPKAEPVPLSSERFRLVLIISVTASALWAGLTTAFISALSDFLQMESVSPLLIVSLIAIGGTFGLFIALWALVCRFPKAWPYIAGGVLASGAKFLVLWFLVSGTILSNCSGNLEPTTVALARSNYGVPQLFTALLGCILAFFIWLPLKKSLQKEKKK